MNETLYQCHKQIVKFLHSLFYTLTKIHKPTPVGRPIISGVSGPTERSSAFVDKLLQPIAQQQKSYLKDTTDFINFMEGTRVPENTVLVSMDVTSLYTNIPQEEGIQTVCRAYNSFYNDQPPIPMRFLEIPLGLRDRSFFMSRGGGEGWWDLVNCHYETV